MGPNLATNFDTEKAIRIVMAASLALLILAVFPLTPKPAMDIKILLLHWTALVLSILLAGHALQQRPAPRTGLIGPLFAAFVAVNAFAGLLSQHPGNSLAEIGRLVALFVFFLAASRAYSDHTQVKRLFLVICIAVACASAYGFLQYFGLDPFPWDEPVVLKDLPATFGNPNLAGHVLLLTMALAAYLAFAERSRLALALIPVFALHHLLTHHRGGILGAAVGAAIVIALLAAKPISRLPRRAHVAAVFFLLVAAASGLAMFAAAPMRFLPLDESMRLRYNSFYSASKMIVECPILGYGPGNYEIDNVPFWTPLEQEHYARNHKLNDHPHCELLYAGVSAGLPSAGLFLAVFAAAFAAAVAGFRRARSPESRNLNLMFAAFIGAWFIDGLLSFNFRAPVSGALFAAVAGILDRSASPAATHGLVRWRFARTAGLVAAACWFAFLATRAFVAAALLDGANSDIRWRAFARAERTLQEAEGLAPWNWEISYLRAHACSNINGNDQAAESLKRALDKNPNYLPAIIDLAKHDLNQSISARDDLLQEAEHYARRATELCKPLPEALDILGMASLLRAIRMTEQGKDSAPLLKQSRSFFADAITCGDGKKNRLYDLVGQTYALQQNYPAAEAEFQKAARFSPPDTPVWQSYRQLAQRTGDYGGLIAALQEAVAGMRLLPDEYKEALVSTTVALGDIAREAGNNELACASYQQAVQLQPDHAAAWDSYLAAARALDRLDQFFTDAAAINQGLFSEPDPDFHVACARNLLAKAGPAQARNHIINALASLPFDEKAKTLLQQELAALPDGK